MLWKAEGLSALEWHHEGAFQIYFNHISTWWCQACRAIQIAPSWCQCNLRLLVGLTGTQVGPVFKFKAWMDARGRIYSSVADDGDGDGDDESPRTRPTRKPLVTTTSSLTSISNGWLKSKKRPHISSTEDKSNKTNAEASLQVVKQWHHLCTDSADAYTPDDRPVPKNIDKHPRNPEDQSLASHQMMNTTAKKPVLGQLKLAIELVPSAQVQLGGG